MIITTIRELQDVDARTIWNSLRRFQNVNYVTERLVQMHSLSIKQTDNARKQAEQIRFCLLQAAEYFDAARAVSLATKPVLLYYGVMSLALTEVLFKQDGMSSLDMARGQNAHHGLDFKIDAKPKPAAAVKDSARNLRATPYVGGAGERFGTFELWHNTSREAPVAGIGELHLERGHLKEADIIGAPSNQILPKLGNAGVTLWDCFLNLPSLRQHLNEIGVDSHTVRAQFNKVRTKDFDHVYTLVIQPSNRFRIEAVRAQLMFKAALVDRINVTEFPSGFSVRIDVPVGTDLDFNIPMAFQSSVDEFFFPGGSGALNEFGLLYAAIFILGNYARYYPDVWMVDVERCSELATATEAFVACVEERAALLTLSELTQTAHLLERRRGAQV